MHGKKVDLHLERLWNRNIAIVTDHNWVAIATRMFAFAMPCPVKVFSGNERDEAEAWITV